MGFSNCLRAGLHLCCRAGTILILICAQMVPTLADPAAGKSIFDSQGCESCHAISGPVTAVAVEERSKLNGPPIWFAGSKFQPDWLVAWLQQPTPIRRINYGSLDEVSEQHPALSTADAEQVGVYLSSLADPETQTGMISTDKLPRRKMFRGEKLFTKKQVCFGCHQYPSKMGDIGGFTGPTMVGAGSRLQGDWVYAFLKDPLHYYPNGRMPVYGQKAYESFTDEELRLLSQYLTNL